MFIIITRSKCNFCDVAKALLKEKGFQFVQYNIESRSSRWILALMKEAEITTVPQVFSPSGERIGGHIEVARWLRDNKE